MKRVTDLIIGELYDEAAFPATLVSTKQVIEDADWTAGDIVVLKADGGILTDATAAAYTGDIQVARFDNGVKIYKSAPIKKANVRSVSVKAYTAPVKGTHTVTIPATVVVGDVYGFYIKELANVDIQRYVRQSAFTTAKTTAGSDVATALAAAINANIKADVTATVSTNVITLTEKNFRYPVMIIPSGLLTDADVTPVVAPVYGSGTADDMKIMEENDLGYKGHFNRVEYVDTPTKYTVAASQYHLIVIEHAAGAAPEQFVHGEGYGKDPLSTIVAIKKTTGLANATGANTLKSTIEKWAKGAASAALEV